MRFEYERESYAIEIEHGGFCVSCGSKDIRRTSRYTPDFFFNVWIVEAKGKFTPRDRKRVLALREAQPTIRFALLFQRDNWLTKSRKMRYSDWARKNDIPYAVGWFKEEWLK